MSMIKDNRYSLDSKFIKTDVTAIECVSHYILAGIGNILHIFDLETLECCYKYKVLNQFRIHGIRRFQDRIAFFGNRVVVVAYLNFEKDISITVLAEWIVGDWIWDICWVNEDQILILTANNLVTEWEWRTQQNVKTSICRSKCLLCCGIILGNDWNNCVVICGTMFRKITIWAPSLNDNEGYCKTLHKLTGHQGAIFSICYNETLKRISSTSDDRSAKVWEVCFSQDSGSWVEKWRNASFNLLFTIYGHLSRVWKSHLLDDAKLITAGEDSQLRIWNENGTALYHWETHQGASIRSLTINTDRNLIITGGKDGGISLWPLSANYAQQRNLKNEIKFKETFGIECIQDIPRRLILSRSKKLLTVTNKGMVLIYQNNNWDCLVTDQRFASYCLFEASREKDCISLASICGTVIILQESLNGCIKVILDEKICSGRIYSLQWLSSETFITCSQQGCLEVWNLYFKKSGQEYALNKINSFTLPTCKERWLTSAVQYESFYIVGDRDGTVHCYSNQSNPIQSFRKIHGRLGVSCIWCEGDELCSIGRDGFIRYWNVTKNGIEHAASDKLPVKWPTRVIHFKVHGLLVLGFNEVNFEVWNIRERKQLMMYKCGGGHRPWDFSIDDCIQFVFIKEKTISNVTVPLDQLVKPSCLEGFHIREIDCLRYLEKDLILSGGEDTTFRVSNLNNEFLPISIIRCHLSSVWSIDFVKIKDFYVVVTGGGRAQIKLWKFFKNEAGLWKYNELGSHMIRPTNKCRKPWKHMIYTYELEPRHMDLKIRSIDENTVVIYAAGSDAVWRIYSFSYENKILKLEKEVDYVSHCILKILYLNWLSKDIIITMSTDGKVTFWDLCTFSKFWQLSIHQNGINSCDFVIRHDNSLMLVTGGDDTAVIFSIIKSTENGLKLSDTWKNDTTHEAQVSGLTIINEHVITAGGDQRVVLWKWLIENHKIQTSLIAVYHSLIPDIHGFDVLEISGNQIEICLYGAGVEIIKIKLHRETC